MAIDAGAPVKDNEKFINLGVVRNQKGEILMIRRVKEEVGRDGKPLIWAFPGGKQRFGETREECVKREVLAETGYDVRPAQQISLRMHPNFTVLIAYHLCELNAPKPVAEPAEPHEVAEIRWIPPKEVIELAGPALDPDVKRTLGG